jgi:hypothetical protein
MMRRGLYPTAELPALPSSPSTSVALALARLIQIKADRSGKPRSCGMDEEAIRLRAELHRFENMRAMIGDRRAREVLAQLIDETRRRLREIAPGPGEGDA